MDNMTSTFSAIPPATTTTATAAAAAASSSNGTATASNATTWTATLPFHGILHYSTSEPAAPAGDKLYKSEIDLFQYTNKLYKNVIIRFDPATYPVSTEPGCNQWKSNGSSLIKDIIANSKKLGACILVSNGSSTNKSDRKLCCSNYRNRSIRNKQQCIDTNTPPRKLCKVHLLLDFDDHSFFLRCGMGFATHTGHMRNEKIQDSTPRSRARTKRKAATTPKKETAKLKKAASATSSGTNTATKLPPVSEDLIESMKQSIASTTTTTSTRKVKQPVANTAVKEIDTTSRLNKYLNYDDLLAVAATTTSTEEDNNAQLYSPASVLPTSAAVNTTIPFSNLFNVNAGSNAANYTQLLTDAANNAAAAQAFSTFPQGTPFSFPPQGIATMPMQQNTIPTATQPTLDFLTNPALTNQVAAAVQQQQQLQQQQLQQQQLQQQQPVTSAALNANALSALNQANFSTDVFSNPLIAAALNTLTSGNYSSSPSAAAAAALDLFSQFTQNQGPNSG